MPQPAQFTHQGATCNTRAAGGVTYASTLALAGGRAGAGEAVAGAGDAGVSHGAGIAIVTVSAVALRQ